MDDNRKEVLHIFESLKKKYNLEDLGYYEDEFFFYIDKPANIVWEITSTVLRRTSIIKSAILGILNPSGFLDGFESKFFTSEDKDELFPVLKRLAALDWESINAFTKKEEVRIQFLKKAVSTWIDIKPVIEKISNKMSSNWLEQEKQKRKNDNYIS
ncbi:Uncharacterised protein [Candidatus Tiddalikarchaeum anstoanum]|nr:Uncharacterised protein [Candidatus Tiddalikarchaeum anstoanum]